MIPLSIDKQPIPKKGDLLLSEPFLLDSNFTRSVILVCEHNDEGSFGLILNNTLDLHLHSIIENFPDISVNIGFGGPVERAQLFYIHTYSKIEKCIDLGGGFFLGGDYLELIEQLKMQGFKSDQARFFIGYTGWAAGQLETELDEKTWIVLERPENFDLTQINDDTLWKDLVALKGGKYKRMADYPVNPADN